MYCNHCGKKNTKSAKFCQSCGKALGAESSKEAEEMQDDTSTTSEPDTPRSYLANKIREKSLRRLYFGFALLLIAVIILLSQANYIANILSGPRSIDPEALETEILSGNINDINVTLPLTPDGVYNAGYTHITQTINENTKQVESTTTDGEYYLTILGKHIVVLEGLQNQLPSGTFTGAVIPLPTDLQNKLVADFNNDPKLQGLSTDILPYEISNKGIFGMDQLWVLLLGLGLLVWGGIVVIKRLNDKDDKNHYIYKITAACGFSSIDELSADFVKTKSEKFVEIGDYYLNHKYLYNDGNFSFQIFPLSQLFWAYKSVVSRRVNFIPTGKHYELTMHFRPDMKVSIKEDEENVNQYLYILATLYPHVKYGYR